MLAIEVDVNPKQLIASCAGHGLLICKTGGNAVRFLPPLNVTKEQVDEGVQKLQSAFAMIGD